MMETGILSRPLLNQALNAHGYKNNKYGLLGVNKAAPGGSLPYFLEILFTLNSVPIQKTNVYRHSFRKTQSLLLEHS